MTGHDLRARDLTLGYDTTEVVAGLDMAVPDREITAIVGANACGKSTVLRGLGRLLPPRTGAAYLDGQPVHQLRTRDVAKVLGLLPQSPTAPDGITVADLVGRGRYPHQGWLRRWDRDDEAATDHALAMTGTAELIDRPISTLSGGQRQRVWIAMVLAQETDILLLDEPTTFLDISHQVELLDLLVDLNRDAGKTIVIVLHDLNLACRYAGHLVAMKDGAILAQGPPHEVITAELVTEVFGVRCAVIQDPISGTPMVVPQGRHHAARAEGTAVP